MDTGDGPLRVVVIDDHEVLRAGTKQVLETTADIVVVGEADSWETALAVIAEQRPDVALVDIQLAGRNGIDLARQLTTDHPETRLVILSAYDDDSFIRRAFEAGVAGYLLKTMPRDELINAIRAVGMGTTVLDPAVSVRLAGVNTLVEVSGAPAADPAGAGGRGPGGRRFVQQGDRHPPGGQHPHGGGPRQPRLHQTRSGVPNRIGAVRVDQRPPAGTAGAPGAIARNRRPGVAPEDAASSVFYVVILPIRVLGNSTCVADFVRRDVVSFVMAVRASTPHR